MRITRFIFPALGALALAFALCPGGYGTATASDTNPVLIGSWPDFPRGWPATSVVAVGNHAYIATWAGLDILDLSQPSNPQHLTSCASDGHPWYVAVSGQFAYLLCYDGLDVIDVADPSQPQAVGHYPAPSLGGLGGFYCLAVSDNHAYATSVKYEGTNLIYVLLVFDVSSPANPQLRGWCPIRRYGSDLVVSGSYAYVAENEQDSGGLEVVDISNPAAPEPVGWYAAGAGAGKVALSGNCACLAGPNGLHVIDISNPASPQSVWQSGTSWNVRCLAFSGQYAYAVALLAGGPPRLKVIDLADPAHPKPMGESDTLVRSWPLGSSPLSIAVSGHYAYVGLDEGGVQVVDISNPANPQRLGVNETMGGTLDVALSGNYAYLAEVGAGLKVIDVSNPASPKKVGDYSTTSAAWAVVVSGTYAYVTELTNEDGAPFSLEVVDISNPADPKHVGEYNPGVDKYDPLGVFRKVALSGNYAYLPGPGGLQVVDISDPANPRRVGVYADAKDLTGKNNQSVVVAGDYAYVANGTNGLLVLDVSDPTNITKVGGCEIGTDVQQIAVSGHFACLAGPWDLHVIDVSDPANPLLAGQYENPYGGDFIGAMAASGNYLSLFLYPVMPGGGGLLVVDISDPAHPQPVGERFFQDVADVAMSSKLIYMAGDREGLLILEMQPFIKSVAKQGQDLKLSWEGFGLARLQRATRLTDPDWQDVPGSEATNNITLPIEGASAFFRLAKP